GRPLGARGGLRQPRRGIRRGRRRRRPTRRRSRVCGARAARGKLRRMRVTICDVSPRDGLQNEAETLEPATRAALVNRLAAAGVPRVEAASFLRPDAVPQMARAQEVVAGIERRPGTEYSGLALNERGYERLVASGLDRVNYTLAATETFNQRNGNRSLAEAQDAAAAVLDRSELPVTLTISVAFGCPFEG